MGLCYRCEYRALFHETGNGPRCECQDPKSSVRSCYMYKPVKPVVLAPNEGDSRPMFAGAMISCRSHFVRVAEGRIRGKGFDDGVVLYWDFA